MLEEVVKIQQVLGEMNDNQWQRFIDGYYVYSYAKCYCLRVLRVTMCTPMLNVTV